MKIKLEITSKGLSDIPERVTLWESEIETEPKLISTFVIAIQKAVNRFIAHVNQDQNNKKAL
ncbi:MAG: hypothetical protein M0022_00695 [Desulfobacteraceae bacterium]|nr:hypothetical protein [Desulfobacteraceae bacterium]